MILRQRRGLALIMVLVFVLAVALIAGTFVLLSLNEVRRARRQKDSAKAFYLAESGINRVAVELNQAFSAYLDSNPTVSALNWFSGLVADPRSESPSYVGPPVNAILGEGKYSVSIEAVSVDTSAGYADVTLESTGNVDNVTRIVRTVIRYTLASSGMFNYGILTDGSLTLENITSGVTADVHSNNDIGNEGVIVTGTGTAVGTITGSEHFDDYVESAAKVSLPELDMEYYSESAYATYDSDLTLSGDDDPLDLDGKIYYISGNFKAENGAEITGSGIIVVTGTITAEAGSIVGSAGNVVGFFSSSTTGGSEDDGENAAAIKLETNTECHAVAFAPYGRVKVETESDIYGAIIAKTAKIETGGKVEYEAPSGGDFSSYSVSFSTTSWDDK